MAFVGRVAKMFNERIPRERRERGGSMVEFAIVSPLFFFVVFAAIEGGLMFRTHLVLEDMSRSAARVAAIERDDPGADPAILTSVFNRDASLPGGVSKVIVFSAATLDSELPAACIDTVTDQPFPVAGVCNAYGADYGLVADGSVPPQTNLGPAERDQWKNLGVYVEYEYNFVTGFLGEMTLASTSVQVVELDQ